MSRLVAVDRDITYHPAVLLGLLIYGYASVVFFSRKKN